jgi:2-amino-4-hydroxy-6-hydroxymethyldihydropteridine diphosphokinase
MMSDIAYIGLGSNIENPKGQIHTALVNIQSHEQISIQHCSHLYASAPMGPKNQPDYINSVIRITTGLTPIELLDVLQAIEQQHGRRRIGERWGPRTLDLDILLFNNLTMDNDRLTLPHYGMAQREFVMVPLFEIEPDMIMQDGKTIAAWVAQCSLTNLKRLPGTIDLTSLTYKLF